MSAMGHSRLIQTHGRLRHVRFGPKADKEAEPTFSRGYDLKGYAAARQAAALFLIAPTIAVSMAPPAPPAITCEMIPSTLRLPDCAAAVIAGSNKVTIWPSTRLRSNRR